MSFRFPIPPFEPHPLLRNPHVQTLGGAYLPGLQAQYCARRHRVALEDGDTVVLHEDFPKEWRPGGRIALLLHGLAGCHLSVYMVRIAAKLCDRGIRTFRMDLRGCGSGAGLAARPYHAGRSEDARAAVEFIRALSPDSPVMLAGFSLSGNIVLKLLGESPSDVPSNIERAVAVCPAIDLAACAQSLVGALQRIYDRHFVRLLCQQVEANRRLCPEVVAVSSSRRLNTLFEFDDAYTGPVCGFGSARNYYETNSAARHLGNIRVPTLILAAKDDPLVPASCFADIAVSSKVLLHLTDHGGHLGFIGKSGVDPDRRWMEWRIRDWASTELTRDDHSIGLPVGTA